MLAGLVTSPGRSNSTPLIMKNNGIKNPEPIDVRRYWSISTLVSIAIIIPAV